MVYDEQQKEHIYAWREKNREKYLAQNRKDVKKHYEENAERIRKRNLEYYHARRVAVAMAAAPVVEIDL